MPDSIRTYTATLVAALAVLALWPAAGQAAAKTEMLRVFSKDLSMTLTRPDGTVLRNPEAEPGPGDIIDVSGIVYRGNHLRHASRWTISHHTRCTFPTPIDAPDCIVHVAIGGSLLIIDGASGAIINGTGRYQGAGGRLIKDTQVKGGSDVVAKIRLRGSAHSARAAEPAWERALRIRGEAMNRLR